MAKSKPVVKKKAVVKPKAPAKKVIAKKAPKKVPKKSTTAIPSFSDEEGAKIKHWLTAQRYKYQQGKLSQEQITELEKIPNWSWSNRTRFDQAVNAIKNYVDRTGNLNPPTEHRENGRNLKVSIYNYKKRFADGKLDDYQIKALESIKGWTWEMLRSPRSHVRFDEMLLIAKAYLKQQA